MFCVTIYSLYCAFFSSSLEGAVHAGAVCFSSDFDEVDFSADAPRVYVGVPLRHRRSRPVVQRQEMLLLLCPVAHHRRHRPLHVQRSGRHLLRQTDRVSVAIGRFLLVDVRLNRKTACTGNAET